MDSKILTLINLFSKIPGLGPSSSRRLVLKLLTNKNQLMRPLLESMSTLMACVKECNICHNLDVTSPCTICTDPCRDKSIMCVVAECKDLWALEKNKVFNGIYHILGGCLSVTDGKTPENTNLKNLLDRIVKSDISELLVAVSPTLEGQVTTNYIMELTKNLNLKISRLACGVPIGGELEYLDEGTLRAAIIDRHSV